MESSDNKFPEKLDQDNNIPIDSASGLLAGPEIPLPVDADLYAAPVSERPLPKIHPNLHHTGRYRMFSNHSSSNDIPGTSTGI